MLDGKTNERIASALYPDWVKKWNLEDMKPPKLSCQTFQQYGDRCCKQFKRYKVPFVPYDLRHAWALRAAIKFRLPETVAAKLIGHSVAVHHKTYHRWLSAIEQRQAYISRFAHFFSVQSISQTLYVESGGIFTCLASQVDGKFTRYAFSQ